jgi:hypothetical protein
MVTSEPPGPAPAQPAGRLTGAAEAEADADAEELDVAEAMTELRSALRVARVAGVAKRVRAAEPPHMDEASPPHGSRLVEVFDKAAPLVKAAPQKHWVAYLLISPDLMRTYSTPARPKPCPPQNAIHLANVMLSSDMEAPVRARPVVPSAIVTSAPPAPAPTQGEGRETDAADADADDDAAAELTEAEAMTVLRSALRVLKATGVAKRVRAALPPHMVVLSPEQGMPLLGESFDSAAPLLRYPPQ